MGGLLASFNTYGGRPQVAAAAPRWCLACLVVLVCFLSSVACTPTIRLENEFPYPAIDPLPLHAAVVYSDEFQGYIYRSPRGVDAVDVELGPSQVQLLDRMLGGLFLELSRQDTWPTGDDSSGVDIVIAPRVERFTLHSPAFVSTTYYEVQIAYRLDLYTPAGQLLGGLPIQGYGRSPARWSSVTEPVRQATIRAMRDAAVQVVLQLPEQPALEQLLRDRHPSDSGRSQCLQPCRVPDTLTNAVSSICCR